MLLCEKSSIDDITVEDINKFPYFPRPAEEYWKCEMLQQLLEEKVFRTLDKEETEWLNHLASH